MSDAAAALTPARIVPAAVWLEQAHAITVPVPGLDVTEATRFAPYLALVEDVRLLVDDWCLLNSAGSLLIESLHQRLMHAPARSRFIARYEAPEAQLALPEISLTLDEPCVLLGYSASHYHWLIDYLPRLYSVEQFAHLKGLPLLVGANITAAHVASLAHLGIPSSQLLRLDPAAVVRCRHLWVPSILSDGLGLHPVAFKWLRRRFASLVPAAAGRERLFVSRRDATTRQLINEDAVMAEAARFGFVRIEASRLDFAEQVARFGRAEAVIGVTGSGLSNAVFAPAGAAFIELHNMEQGAAFIEVLTAQLGQRYVRLPGEPRADAQRGAHNFDFSLDPLRLREALLGLGLQPSGAAR
jgi:capsular polysaccharide biosynthesis protein